jgi:Flp pilus assembly secretin CpaC
MTSIAFLLVTQVATAVEPAKPSQHQLLQQKCAELDRLQADIIKLREATGTPAQIRVDVQMLEVHLTKLRNEGISTVWFSTGEVSQEDLKLVTQVAAERELNNNLRFVNWLRQQNFAKPLADPSLVVVSGQPAEFHVGGEIPFPNMNGKSETGVLKFGTELKVHAQALGANQVRLDYKARVSSINHNNLVEIQGERVPEMQVREVDSGCELSFGDTAIMAGLVQKRVEASQGLNREVVEKTIDVGLMLVITPELFEHTEKKSGNAGNPVREAFPVAQR